MTMATEFDSPVWQASAWGRLSLTAQETAELREMLSEFDALIDSRAARLKCHQLAKATGAAYDELARRLLAERAALKSRQRREAA